MHLPLDGIRVLDWTAAQQGPAAAVMLGDMGADVIHIEDPKGDMGRDLVAGRASLTGNRNYYFEANNRNKRGIVLDLKNDAAREILYRLVEKSDVFMQNWRVGVAARLGVDYRTLSKYNPKLVYASGSAFGPEGPDAEKPGFDMMASARSGLMLAMGHPDWPPVFPRGLSDQMGATLMTCSILAALLLRDRFGVGQEVNTSLLGSIVFAQQVNISYYLIQKEEFGRRDRKNAQMALQNLYQCADGEWIVLAMTRDARYWHDFCHVLGEETLENDPRFSTSESRKKNNVELIAELDKIFATRPRAEWLERLGQNEDLLYTYVNRIPDLENDPQIVANKYIVDVNHPVLGKIKQVALPIRFSKTPASIRREAPNLGQHTEEILAEVLGYGPSKIAELKAQGTIR